MPRKLDLPATLCLITTTFCWAGTPVLLKYLTAYVPDGFTTNMVRYPFAMLFYLPLLIHSLRRGRLGSFWLLALIPAAVNLGGQTLWACGPYYLDAGVLAFMLRLSSIWCILAALLVFPDERPLARAPIFWAGVFLALAGFTVMSWAHLAAAPAAGLAGVLLMLICSLCYGMYGVTVRYVMRDLHPLVVFSVIGSYTSVGLILMGPLGEPGSLLRVPAWPMAVMLLSACTGIALAHGTYYVAVQRIGVAVSALSMSVTPFISLLAAYLVLGERFATAQWIGGVILVAGATLALGAQQRLVPTPLPDPHETGNE